MEPIYGTPNVQVQTGLCLTVFIVLSLFFGALLSSVSPVLAVELAMGFTLALLHPVNALCFFVHMLFLRPWDLLPGNPLLLALPRLLALACLISWFLHPWRHGKPNDQTFHALTLLLGFGFWVFLSTFKSAHVVEAQASWFDTLFKSLVVFVMCSFFIENERSLSEFRYTLLLSIFAMGVLGLYQFLLVGKSRLGALSMLDPNDLAALSVIAIPLALASVFSRKAGMFQRVIGVIFFGMALLAIWYSQSRGALLALAAQLVGFKLIRNHPKRVLTTVLTIICVGLGYALTRGMISRTPEDLDESSASRLTYWETAIKMTASNPFLGVGFDQFPEKYESYSSSLKYEWGKRTAHSSWLLAFAESGIFGGILFLAFFLTVWRTAWRNRQTYPDQLYALGGYAVAMSFLSHTYLLFPYLLYGLIMASDSVQEKSEYDA